MNHIFRKLAAVAVAMGTIALAGANTAQAGIFLELQSGVETQTFFVASNNLVQSTSIDGYTLEINTVSTNYPGSVNGGSLTSTVQFSTASTGTIQGLTITAEVVDSATPDGSGGFIAGPLSVFSSPSFNPSSLGNDLAAQHGLSDSGEATFSSTVNGTTLTTGPLVIPGHVMNSTTVDTTGGYTMMNQLVISGVLNGAENVSVTGGTTVVAPEPATLAIAFSALPLLGFGALRRRRTRS